MKKTKNKKKNKRQRKNKDKTFQKPTLPSNNKKPTVSVCLIVKNEEQFIDNCLKSVQDIADEIIIIDTGSQDDTVEIAKKYTDKIYFHPWQESYSEARNYYFEYATGDWIFQIDADEELVKEDIPTLLKAVKNTDIDAIILQIISQLNKGKSESRHSLERIFRNNEVIHYEGRIHERLTGFKKPMIYPIGLLHYGYDLDDKDVYEKKLEARIRLLKQDIEDDPENPLPYHYLSCCYLSKNLLQETLASSLKAIELSEKQNSRDPVYLWSRYNASQVYYKLNDYKNTESTALSAIEKDKSHVDSYYILTALYLAQSKWDQVLENGNIYLNLREQIKKYPDRFGITVFNSLDEHWNVYTWMGIASYEKGKVKEAEKLFQSAISISKTRADALKKIGTYYYNKAQFLKAGKFLKKAIEINRDDDDINRMMTQIGSGEKVKPSISCCMIVKNEEAFLEKCLSSVKDFVDEIVIVDTGSTDNTVEIARRFTDRIYFHPWENSFCKSRNQALQYATGDWILQIDADEVLVAGSGPKLHLAVRDAEDADLLYTKINNSYANGTKKSFHFFERIFKNNGKIRYEGNIHEQVVGGTKTINSSVELFHFGYDVDEDKALKKFERTRTLLKKEIETDPENPVHHHNLSAAYFARGMSEEALYEAEKAIMLAESQNKPNELFSWTHYIAAMSCYRLNRSDEAIKYALKSLDKNPKHLDAYYVLTITAFDSGKWEDVIKYGKEFLVRLEEISIKINSITSENSINEGPGINMLVGHACHYQGLTMEMEEHYSDAYETSDNKRQVLLRIALYHLEKTDDLNLAEDLLNRAVKEVPEEDKVWLALAKIRRKQDKIEGEIDCLEKVVMIGTEDPFVYSRLFSLYATSGKTDKAMSIIDRHHSNLSGIGPALCILATHFIEKDKIESAIKCYTMALEENNTLFEAWASLGEIMLSLNKIEDSRTFLQKALSLKDNDIGTILNLCVLSSIEGDIVSIVDYCSTLLKVLDLPYDKTLNKIDELLPILDEIGLQLAGNNYYQNQLKSIAGIVSQIMNQTYQ